MDVRQRLLELCREKDSLCLRHIPDYIIDNAVLRSVPQGEYITEKGAPIKSVIICCSGRMQVRNEFTNGLVYNIATIEPVTYIGIMELLADSIVFCAYLKAATDCEIIEIPARIFLNWMEADRDLMYELLRFMCKSMFDQSWTSGDSMIYPAGFLLVRYLVRSYQVNKSEILVITKTTEELGALFGLSRRTIQREIKKLKEDGMIKAEKNKLTINEKQYIKLNMKMEEMEMKL